MDRAPWTIAYFELPDGSSPYATFLSNLDPYQRSVVLLAVEEILAREGTDVCATEWGKALGGGLYEFRIRRSLHTIASNVGRDIPGMDTSDRTTLIRVFFTTAAGHVIVLLGGFDKKRRPHARWQDRQIRRARSLLREARRTGTATQFPKDGNLDDMF